MMIQKCAGVLCLVLMAGCGSLPLPDRMAHTTHAVRVNGAQGSLSAQKSEAVVAGLKNGSPKTNIFDRHLAQVEELMGPPLVTGNKVTLLLDGPATYKSMFSAIQGAKNHINMETYSIEDDEIGHRFAAALIERQRKGVQVNFIYDSVGSGDTPKEFFKSMMDSGINVLEFNPINPLTLRKKWEVGRDHRKLLVVDGQVAFVGGVNISSVYSSGSFTRSKPRTPDTPPWRDTHLRIEGPVVSDFQKLFLATWEKQKGEPPVSQSFFPKMGSRGNEVVRAIGSSPDASYSAMYVTLLSAINSAETHAYITTAYFVPDPQLLAALKAAAQRNVDVRLMLPDKTDSNLVYYASHSYYDELLSAGVKIYEREDAVLHAKTALIDGVWSTIGSTNLDWLSFQHNQEINAVILGQDFGEQMKAMFEKDIQSSRLVRLEKWRQRSIGVRLKELGARLWARWI
ncbi:cardiolipin synthase [Nitrosospira sp. Nsp5]|uniref:Cardiolipin synthase n=1 Tax=Nitrosospira multiformis TaxID=1231 RepID=A0ABY0TI56_9PROT|nr:MULTISPECIES: cardiolipin synthase [Nitrosospira]PTR06757.1 cardiolipin synthase [Nitrosospira sp. Nsp5]SDQ87481.1 cardiolipin synthase [Nitrosospira multiformis]